MAVISPAAEWNWIPSNIWVGVGRMDASKVLIPLRPIYQRKGITFYQGLATAISPEGTADESSSSVDFTYTDEEHGGETESLAYDYLINATGPQLNFAATPGLGPDGYSYSVCTAGHAVQAAKALELGNRSEDCRTHRRRPAHCGDPMGASEPSRPALAFHPHQSEDDARYRGWARIEFGRSLVRAVTYRHVCRMLRLVQRSPQGAA